MIYRPLMSLWSAVGMTLAKPLIRALHQWCSDNGFTPYIAVVANGRAKVPREFVRDGQIVLNINIRRQATSISAGSFQRFGGIARDISVPIGNVLAIYAGKRCRYGI